MKILIKNADIITMNAKKAHFSCGSLCTDDDKIVYIGENDNVPSDFHPDRVIDAHGSVLLPGMINAHTHLGMTLFRGYANDLPLWEWLSERVWPLEDQLTAEDVYWASMLGIMEMLRWGTTTFSDMYFFMEDVARAVEQSGIRAVLARGLQGPDAKGELRLKENRDLFRHWHGKADDRIRVMVGPHAEYTCSPEYLNRCVALSQELGAGIHIHVSETRREFEECIQRHGKTPIAHLADLGVLDRPVTAAHCVIMEAEDIEIAAEKGVHIIHNPGSNLKLASGVAPVSEFLERGIPVCLGTDSAASNNNLNLWEELSLSALIHKAAKGDATTVPAYKALEMATVHGAHALGWSEEIGSLEAGKKADLILVNTKAPHYYPKTDIVSHLVYSGQASDVELTMVNGKILMEKGTFPSIDAERVYHEIDRIGRRLYG